jgi:hypothetical protein
MIRQDIQVKDELDRLIAEWSDKLFFFIIVLFSQKEALSNDPWLEL